MIPDAVPIIGVHVRERWPDLSTDMDNIEAHFREYEELFVAVFVPEPDPTGDPALSLRDKTRLLVISVTAHARALTWSLIDAINRDSPQAAFLLLRAHFEVAGMMAHVLVHLRKYVAGESSAKDFHEVVIRLLLGTRKHPAGASQDLIARTTATNVLTFVNAVDKVGLSSGGQFREAWEMLSEFCHPNTFSRVISGQRRVEQAMHFDMNPSILLESITSILPASLIAQETFLFCRQEAAALTEQMAADVSGTEDH